MIVPNTGVKVGHRQTNLYARPANYKSRALLRLPHRGVFRSGDLPPVAVPAIRQEARLRVRQQFQPSTVIDQASTACRVAQTRGKMAVLLL